MARDGGKIIYAVRQQRKWVSIFNEKYVMKFSKAVQILRIKLEEKYG